MKRKKRQQQLNAKPASPLIWLRVREGLFILSLSLTVFFLLALLTFHPEDPAWTVTQTSTQIHNATGPLGAWCADILLTLFGVFAYGFPVIVGLIAFYLFTHRFDQAADWTWEFAGIRIGGFLLVLLSGCTLIHLYFAEWPSSYPSGLGGVIGFGLSIVLLKTLHVMGATVLLMALLLVGMTFTTGFSWLKLIEKIGQWMLLQGQAVRSSLAASKAAHADLQMQIKTDLKLSGKMPKQRVEPVLSMPSESRTAKLPALVQEKIIEPLPVPPRITHKKPVVAKSVLLSTPGDSVMPSSALLDPAQPQEESVYSETELRLLSEQVELKLADFGVQAHVVAVQPGPVITRFELELAAGIKASKISGLAKDLARSLAIVSVRVVEIIPGKPYVGLELPNINRQKVCLSELIESEVYQKSTSPLSLVLGKDISGLPVVVDLAKMPHLLVAGTTGSGKSVGLNAMLLSILFKATPEEVRMILIDPKMLELAVYDNIPHLLAPVVTDVKEAGNALKWCVAEMERRYRLMAALGVRNLTGYNRKIQDAQKAGTPIPDPLFTSEDSQAEVPPLSTAPYIVVVIDEFADMMMVVGKKVEELIARIAQKARAAGIHLILATQRPSVDVITGLIKANVPTRIAFQVASRIDSRTILDQQGAEQLLGRGDMLYLPVGAGVPMRVHGAFVSDQEVHAVAEDWKKRARPEYEEGIISVGGGFELDESSEDAESDPLYDQAVAIVIETRRASISMVQRRLKIGYNRAARLIEQMEAAGLVSSMQANGSRELLVPGGH